MSLSHFRWFSWRALPRASRTGWSAWTEARPLDTVSHCREVGSVLNARKTWLSRGAKAVVEKGLREGADEPSCQRSKTPTATIPTETRPASSRREIRITPPSWGRIGYPWPDQEAVIVE